MQLWRIQIILIQSSQHPLCGEGHSIIQAICWEGSWNFVWFYHVPKHIWLTRSTWGIWNRHSDSRMWATDTAWLDCLHGKEKVPFFIYTQSSGQSARALVCSKASIPLIQTASFSFCRATDEGEHCLWFYSWWTLNKIFPDIDLCFIAE